jgi:hypothetical protein
MSGIACANFGGDIFVFATGMRGLRCRVCARYCLQERLIRSLCMHYSSSGRKIPGLPNNLTSEMIGGCEIRSISGQCPPPRPLHDDPVECRLVVHGF